MTLRYALTLCSEYQQKCFKAVLVLMKSSQTCVAALSL